MLGFAQHPRDARRRVEGKGRGEEGRIRQQLIPIFSEKSHALYIYFPLFIPAGLLGQFGEPLLEVVLPSVDVGLLPCTRKSVPMQIRQIRRGTDRQSPAKHVTSARFDLNGRRRCAVNLKSVDTHRKHRTDVRMRDFLRKQVDFVQEQDLGKEAGSDLYDSLSLCNSQWRCF